MHYTSNSSYRTLGALFTLLLLIPVPTARAAEPITLAEGTVARPATREEAVRVLTSRDDFVRNLSPFDRAARLKTDRPVTEAQLLEAIAAGIRPMTDDEWDAVAEALEWVRDRLKPYDIKLPKEVLFVKVKGEVSANAAYTRGNVIVFPQRRFASDKKELQRLVAHELFHVISRHDRKLRDQLYEVVGFKPLENLTTSKWFDERKITNPDAPNLDAYVILKIDEREVPIVPVLFAPLGKYDKDRGGTFFNYMRFALMEVRKTDDGWQAVTDDKGRPKMYDADDVPDYFAKIGKNTPYIIHPEEVLAENFVLVLRGDEDVETPRVVEQMGKLLRRAGKPNPA